MPGGSHLQLHDCHKAVPAAAVANEEQEQQSCDYSVVAELSGMGEKGTAWGVLGAGQGKRIVEGGAVWERITNVSMDINNWVSS